MLDASKRCVHVQINITSIASTIVFITVFSLISTFIPRDYLWVAAVVYFVIMFTLLTLLQRIRARRSMPESRGVALLRSNEKAVMDIMMKDSELFRELSSQSWRMFIPLIISLPLLYFVTQVLYGLVVNNSTAPFHERFVRYLAYYASLSGIMYVIRFVFMPKKMIMPITKYEVYSTGIKYGSMWILFPLDLSRYSVSVDYKRRFVDIYDKKTSQVLRLYAEDPGKLYSLIERHGLRKNA
uniref:DUF2208 domain-containing protein n=1 Tax=Ignisphaera aggregans TaxID=334771 RepID=A0A7C2ZP00_9CREN